MDKDQVLEKIKACFSEQLSGKTVDDDSNFLDLGGDSLGMMAAISRMESTFQVELDPRAVLLCPTPQAICKLVLSCKSEVPADPVPVQVDLDREVVLPEDIQPMGDYTVPASACKTIFLTGATGFLGAYLLRDLLQKDAEIRVYCLTRCRDRYDGLERIKMNMLRFHCWDPAFRHRILAVPGDLTKEKFAMSPQDYHTVCCQADMIFHCGAVLNFLYPYAAMKSANVSSTVECLRIATTEKMKYLNYTSSYSVYDNPSHFAKNALEDDPLASSDGYFLGYSQTKWVSEKIIMLARARGIKAKVYRPGDITGTKQDGIWAVRDLTSRMIIGCIQMQVVPIVEMPLNFTPVDYVSAVMAHIAFMDDGWDKAFNIINPQIKSSAELLKAIYASGLFVLPVPYSVWKAALRKTNLGGNALKILSCMFEDNGQGDIITRHMERQPIYDMFNTRTALEGTDIRCAPMDKELLKSYIVYFKRSHLI